MSIIHRIPANTNFLSKNRFKIVFPRAPKLEYFGRGITLPEISADPAKVETPFTKIWVTGVNTVYNPFTVNLQCDEDMTVWQEIHDWLVGYSFPRSYDEYAAAKAEGLYADMVLMILSNANNPVISITFKSCFPIGLGGWDMLANDDGAENIFFQTTFRYTDYEVFRHKMP